QPTMSISQQWRSTGARASMNSSGRVSPRTSHAEQKSQRALQRIKGTDSLHGKLFSVETPCAHSYLFRIRLSINLSPLRRACSSSAVHAFIAVKPNSGKGKGQS